MEAKNKDGKQKNQERRTMTKRTNENQDQDTEQKNDYKPRESRTKNQEPRKPTQEPKGNQEPRTKNTGKGKKTQKDIEPKTNKKRQKKPSPKVVSICMYNVNGREAFCDKKTKKNKWTNEKQDFFSYSTNPSQNPMLLVHPL